MSEQSNLKKVLGFKEVLNIAIGQTIGSGVMAMTGIAIGMTGKGVVFAYILSSLLVIIMTMPTAAMGSAIPTTGGSYKYITRLLSPTAGIFYIFIYMAYNITLALFAISFADYMQALIPSIPFKLVALALLTVLYLFNIFGVKSAANLQNIMVLVLASGLFLFIVYGVPEVKFDTFTAQSIMPNGFMTLLTVSGLLTFATGGANVIVNLGGEMKNPGRDIPLGMILGTVIVGVIYALMALVASGVLPVEQVAYKNLTEVANTILPKGLYVYFIVGGAMFAIATTLNSTFSWVTKPLLACCQDGWLPKKLGEVNKKYGTPHWLLTLFYIIGVIPIITGLSLETIGVLGSGISLFMALLPVAASFNLHKKYPEACGNAPFMIKPKLFKLLVGVSIVLLIIQSILLFSTLGKNAIVLSLVYAIIALIISLIISRKHKFNFYSGDVNKDFN